MNVVGWSLALVEAPRSGVAPSPKWTNLEQLQTSGRTGPNIARLCYSNRFILLVFLCSQFSLIWISTSRTHQFNLNIVMWGLGVKFLQYTRVFLPRQRSVKLSFMREICKTQTIINSDNFYKIHLWRYFYLYLYYVYI